MGAGGLSPPPHINHWLQASAGIKKRTAVGFVHVFGGMTRKLWTDCDEVFCVNSSFCTRKDFT